MKVHLTIWNQQGNQLFHGQVPSCFDSLRPDDAFWIGEPQAREWVKVARMTYGVCTRDGSVHLEMVVERSEQKPTREARSTPQTIDHGQFKLPEEGGNVTLPKGSWFSLSVGDTYAGGIHHLTIHYKDSSGIEDAKSFTKVEQGGKCFLQTGPFKLIVTVLHWYHGAHLQVTEERRT